MIFSGSLGISRPYSMHRSEVTTPHPPPSVMIATLFPFGRGRDENTAERLIRSMGCSAWIIPAWRQAASKTLILEARAPVWLAAALNPAFVLPPFKTTIGFFLETSAALLKNLFPFFTFSMYKRRVRVLTSSLKASI